MDKKLLFLVAEESYFWSHRLSLARAARDAGFRIYVATHIQDSKERFEAEGILVCETNFSRNNKGVFKQLQSLWQIRKIAKKIQPDVLHAIGLKSVVFSGVATLFFHVPRRIYSLNGLGTLSIEDRISYRVVAFAVFSCMKFLFLYPGARVVVQNQNDFDWMRSLVPKSNVSLIRGSGVDTGYFVPRSNKKDQVVVSLVARMIFQKGVLEYIEAIRILKTKNIDAKFLLVGGLDLLNTSSISENQLLAWQKEGLVHWVGHQKDILAIWHASDIAVLPSYREGLPKSLLEAASCELPLIAFDVPGCREIVQDGKNGFLVSPKNIIQLANKIQILVQDPKLRRQMGRLGRQLVLESLSYHTVNERMLDLYMLEIVC